MTTHVLERGFREKDRAQIVALLREYWAALNVPPCFQGFDAEIEGLPGSYAPPGGEMIVARDSAGSGLVGCVALRPVPGTPDMCEMKRLYVRPAARGTGLGRTLALAAMDEGRRLGYRRMFLDTLPSLTAAQALYRSLGFRQTGTGDGEPPVVLFECNLGPANAPF
jgi:ribosomal protein S18 acetylase RimI-like enzyme